MQFDAGTSSEVNSVNLFQFCCGYKKVFGPYNFVRFKNV